LVGGLFIVLAFGFRTRAVSLLLAVLLVGGKSFRYSFGKIDHHILEELTLAVMAFSRWGDAYSIDALRARSAARPAPDRLDRSGAHALLAICIAFGFLTAGVPKLVGWIDFDPSTQGVRGWLLDVYRPGAPGPPLAETFFRVHSPLFWEALDVAAVAFELSFVVAVLDRRAFQLALCAAAFFHLFNYLMLGIAFATNLIAYAAFAEWDRAVGVMARVRWRVPARPGPALAAMAVCVGTYLGSGWTGRQAVPLLGLLGADRALDLTLLQVAFGAAVATAAIGARLVQWRLHARRSVLGRPRGARRSRP
jgi:hypothetical protein